jgi:uncharacterized protein (TIGR02001 family)
MKFHPAQIALSAVLFFSSAAFAQTPAPVSPAAAEPAASPLSFNISLASNYKFRGQDQDQSKTKSFKPALQGGVDYAFDSGFYIGNWNSTINWTKYLPSGQNSGIEIDLYGGYKFKAGPLDMDVGALTYVYPGAGKANTTEVYIGAGYGPVSAKYSSTVSQGYFGIGNDTLLGVGSGGGRGTGYLNLVFAQEIAPKITLKASLGFTSLKSAANSAGFPDFMDYSVGASYDLGDGLSVSGALVGANKKSNWVYTIDPTKSVNKNTLVVMLTKTL